MMPILTKPPLLEVLPKVLAWFTTNDGFAPAFNALADEELLFSYSAKEFAAINPHLVEILRMNAHCTPGETLVNSLDMWAHPNRIVPLRQSSTNKDRYDHVQNFKSFVVLPHDDAVMICYNKYIIEHTTGTGVAFPIGATVSVTDAPRSWLDKHYPKWELASNIAKSLDMDLTTFTDLITTGKSETYDANMSSVLFD